MTVYRFKKGKTYETKLGHRAEVLSVHRNGARSGVIPVFTKQIKVKCDWIVKDFKDDVGGFYVCVHIDRDGNEFAMIGELWGNVVRLEAKNEVKV